MTTDQKNIIQRKGSLDYYLILATVGVLFAISVICVYGMFYFKFASLQQLPATEKMAYMNTMNMVVAPFIVTLILILGICVPKRLLPARWLNYITAVMVVVWTVVSFWQGIKMGLVVVLAASLLLQLIVLGMALGGSTHLHFEKSGYWTRVGSSLIHLGLILFVLDLLFYKYLTLHLFLFWVTTISSVLGMLFCFYSEAVAGFVKNIRR